jgi:NAD(P)-dependent dehydrogenase (short-subunit alcohol dehydrogenase family)
MSLAASRIVILGGTSGIGLAPAGAVQSEGASVTVTGRSPEKLDAARATLGEAARCVALDASDEAGTRALLEDHERIDHLFITAGTLVPDAKLDGEIESYRPSLDVRFWGAVAAAKYAAPRMSDGSITLMSGTAAMRPLAGASIGSASTAAVEGLARALAIDLAPIRVNAIRPGFVDTPMLDDVFGDNKAAVLADFAKKLPVGRIGRAEELADAVLFLMKNGYVTGIALTVDGGGLLI